MPYPTTIEKYDGTLEELARDVTNMRYDAMAEFFSYIALCLAGDSEEDLVYRGRSQLSEGLELIAGLQSIASDETKKKVWKVCKKYIRD